MRSRRSGGLRRRGKNKSAQRCAALRIERGRLLAPPPPPPLPPPPPAGRPPSPRRGGHGAILCATQGPRACAMPLAAGWRRRLTLGSPARTPDGPHPTATPVGSLDFFFAPGGCLRLLPEGFERETWRPLLVRGSAPPAFFLPLRDLRDRPARDRPAQKDGGHALLLRGRVRTRRAARRRPACADRRRRRVHRRRPHRRPAPRSWRPLSPGAFAVDGARAPALATTPRNPTLAPTGGPGTRGLSSTRAPPTLPPHSRTPPSRSLDSPLAPQKAPRTHALLFSPRDATSW